MKQVVEIIERCAVGTCVSRPFCVRADDDRLYWIKGCGRGWNRNELCYELLAAKMACEFKIPVANHAVLHVSRSLLEFCAVPGIEDLETGPAFGSLHVDNAVSLPPVEIKTVPVELRQKILLFDWWIQNEDRILGEIGGNVNLLWTPASNKLTAIDHNCAFDKDFDENRFFNNHVFSEERRRIEKSFLLEQKQIFADIAARLYEISADLPTEWAASHGMPGDYSPQNVQDVLRRYDELASVFGALIP